MQGPAGQNSNEDGPVSEDCLDQPAGTECNTDNDVCTFEHCSELGVCVWLDIVDTCEAQNGYACLTYECDTVDGCQAVEFHNGASCDDDDSCTLRDECVLLNGIVGYCAGEPMETDDGNACTADLCTDGEVTHTPMSGEPCQVMTGCGGPGICDAGVCVSSGVAECNDGLECTIDACDPATGGCQYELVDGTCRINNQCYQAGDQSPLSACAVCDPSVDLFKWTQSDALCEDGSPCTENFCTGDGCFHNNLDGVACDDGNECLEFGVCSGGVCNAEPVSCDDYNPCTTDFCFPAAGCVYMAADGACDTDGDNCTTLGTCVDSVCLGQEPLDCSDGNDCTTDVCELDGSCSFPPSNDVVECDDGDECTEGDTCAAGECTPTSTVDCNDGGPCVTASCDSEQGCITSPNNGAACDDGDPCSGDGVCAAGVCEPQGNPVGCNDQNPCTADSCDPNSGECVNALADDGSACDDGNACTLGESCWDGACVPASNADCNDDNPCTADACDAGTGCQNPTVDGGPCEDGDECTVGDECLAGVCFAGQNAQCDDGNPCTDDLCTETGGCKNVSVFKPCDDGDACTTGDVCTEGVCQGLGALDCNDNEPCTNDSCDSAAGCNNAATAGGACDDGNECTTDDSCVAGVCQGAEPADCDDNNPCTDDGCSAVGGCTNVANDQACDDNNACTNNACMNRACQITGMVECDDDNACTTDSCDPATGCQNPNLADGAGCDDGDACTSNCTLVEKYTVLMPHPSYPNFWFEHFGPFENVFFNPTDQTVFEVEPDGAARLFGPIAHVAGIYDASMANKNWVIDCKFIKRNGPGTGGPFIQEAFQAGFTAGWTYFDMVAGGCMLGTTDGAALVSFSEKPAPGVFPFQMGQAASSFNVGVGYSNWVNYTVQMYGETHTTGPNGKILNTDFHGALQSVEPCGAANDQCMAGQCIPGDPLPNCGP